MVVCRSSRMSRRMLKPSQVHRQGQVLGRGATRLIARFDDENEPVHIRPHLVRALNTPGGDSPRESDGM